MLGITFQAIMDIHETLGRGGMQMERPSKNICGRTALDRGLSCFVALGALPAGPRAALERTSLLRRRTHGRVD